VNEKVREVRLYGRLGARFGRIHMLAVSSTAEAIRALCVLIPGFERALADSDAHGVRYACFIGKRNIGEEEMRQPVGGDSIRIAPILAGAKQAGLFQTLLGAAMLVVGAITWQPWLMQMGAAIALGGVIQLLSPQQLGLSSQDSPENGASYNFNGAVNTSAQGNPVPLLYGRMIVGSAVISAGIFAEDQV
jgi:predicted phage tail protein